MMSNLVPFLGYTAAILLILGIGGLIADYVFPHVPFIERFIDSLPEWDDEERKEQTYEHGQPENCH